MDFQLEKLKRVATVSFVFERDAALTGGTAEDKTGSPPFTVPVSVILHLSNRCQGGQPGLEGL